MNASTAYATLNNGVKMPWLGLGVYKAEDGAEVEQAVIKAIKAGYRSIDTAAVYYNEEGVGSAIKKSGVAREELFITTKVWNDDQGYESALRAFDQSMNKLGLDVLDLYLVHWPVEGKFKDTWKALETLYKAGKVRAIGVSNFNVTHLEELLKTAEIKPMVNQIEFHPYLLQEDLRKYCKEQGIQVEAWRPLTKGDIFSNPTVQEIANAHNKTPAQVLLRWNIEHEVVTIPKSVTESRIIENSQIFDFELTQEEIRKLDELNEDKRYGPDPETFDF
ncbi:glyoxal reductase [Alkalihalophilus pseudofirmus]|uniref:Aldo/keto reductase n=2 Tax=Alkalihalophilus pseudofirmus TaxID=79885 RepID=A0AAJ2U4A8_ALKPS|nr:aldo/keto reductase [Alkalihalophilus pseudofirmus]MDV2886966.1 aldo/keto reductase [Alkalihalophilus pseudofirmus]OLS38738.1 glyoxal reductase [Alkalihalophilus pseudofirmus]